jgi:hypothetical protein
VRIVINNNVTLQKNVIPAFAPFVLPAYPKLQSNILQDDRLRSSEDVSERSYVMTQGCSLDIVRRVEYLIMTTFHLPPCSLPKDTYKSSLSRFTSTIPTTKDKGQNTSLNRDPLCHKHASLFRSVKQFTEIWYSLFSYRCKCSINVDYTDIDQQLQNRGPDTHSSTLCGPYSVQMRSRTVGYSARVK